MQTSEQGTTASGVFVMPTAAAPTGRSVADDVIARNKQPISNPIDVEALAAQNRQPISNPISASCSLPL